MHGAILKKKKRHIYFQIIKSFLSIRFHM